MSAHTPGPWSINTWTQPDSRISIGGPGTPLIAIVPLRDLSIVEQKAVAVLIVACTDMLEALEAIVQFNVQYCIDRYGDANKAETMACVVTARAAIAKATGAAS